SAPSALLQGFAGMADVDLHVISCTQKRMQSPEKLAPNISFHSLYVPKRGWLRTGYQGCIRATRNKLRELRPDIVHGQGTERDCAISAVFSGLPNVLTLHGNMRAIARLNRAPPLSYLWLAARLERFTLPRADGVVCITAYTQREVVDLARRTWLVPNAVEELFFQVERSPVAALSILCIGNITPRKNQISFIRALDPVAQNTKLKVSFIGRTSPMDFYSSEFLELIKTRSWCEHIPWLDRAGIRVRLRAASLVALPSLEDNCPMVVLEAMAAGVPVAAANVGGVPELVEHGATGLLFDPRDPEDIRRVFNEALQDRQSLERMAATARERAHARFHPRIVAQKHVEIYDEVLRTSS